MDTLTAAATELYPRIVTALSDTSNRKYGEMSLLQLDNWRCHQLPATVKTRLEENDSKTPTTWLTKEELVLLMDWKLAKGKFRPTLPKLIRANDENTVVSVTKEGFLIMLTCLKKYHQKWSTFNLPQYTEATKKSIKKLSELKGVGPATASLMLSLLVDVDRFAPPFFSDESFLYLVAPQDKIKYNVKEYTELLLPVYFEIINGTESNVSFDQLEKGAWALKSYALKRDYELADINYDIANINIDKYSPGPSMRKTPENTDTTEQPKKKRRKN